MRVGQYNVKSPGRPPIYDHTEIKQKILAGWENKEIAADIGCSVRVVSRVRQKRGVFRRKHRFTLTEDEYSKMTELYTLGKLDGEIAQIVGCSSSTVCNWRHENGYSRNHRGHKMDSRCPSPAGDKT